MYFSANHKGIKQNQDYSGRTSDALVICDGIGQFENSGEVAMQVVKSVIKESENKEITLENIINKLDIPDGGTTILYAKRSVKTDESSKCINIEYLGDGGILHLPGNFYNSEEAPYRYAEIMLPHVNPKLELEKYFSSQEKKENIIPTKLELTLNQKSGDILILYSDGISSLGNERIIEDSRNRYWRAENGAIQLILKELHTFLTKNGEDKFNEKLNDFTNDILNKLDEKKMLEDDVSLGIIITKEVLKFYSQKEND